MNVPVFAGSPSLWSQIFTSLAPAEAILVRALANRLDAVTSAVEDAADRLVYLDRPGG
jgi:hypothetical protein